MLYCDGLNIEIIWFFLTATNVVLFSSEFLVKLKLLALTCFFYRELWFLRNFVNMPRYNICLVHAYNSNILKF